MTMIDKVSDLSRSLTTLCLRISEVGAALIGLAVLVYILLGEASGDLVTGIVATLLVLVTAATPQGLTGIAIVAALLWIGGRWQRRG